MLDNTHPVLERQDTSAILLQEILSRLVRVETRLVNAMHTLGLTRDGHPSKGTV